MTSPKEIYEKEEVQVDASKFSLSRWFWDLIKNANKHPWMSPNYYLVRILWMIALFAVWRVMRQPFEWYYHWKDPLLAGSSDDSAGGAAEDMRERARYKKKVKDWQQ